MPALAPVTPLERRRAAAWLPATTPRQVLELCQRALADVGLCELPPGSNRSGRIDEYNQAAGVAPGSYWCASAAGAWCRDVGLEVPAGYASCDNWLGWARRTGRWNPVQTAGSGRTFHAVVPGCFVLYGVGFDAEHIGLVVRTEPVRFTVEGNTTVSPAYSRNGIAVDLKQLDDAALRRVLGYVHPFPLT